MQEGIFKMNNEQKEAINALGDAFDTMTDRVGFVNLYAMKDAPRDGTIIMINHVELGLFQARWTKRDKSSAPYRKNDMTNVDTKVVGELEGWEIRNIQGWQFTESDKFTGWTYRPVLREICCG